MLGRKRKYLLMFIAVSVILGFVFVHFFLPRVVTEIRNPIIAKLNGTAYTIATGPTDFETKTGKVFTVTSFDGTSIVAKHTYSSTDTTYGTVILLHGIRSNKENLAHLANALAIEGYGTIAVDLRGHGFSGGGHCTFGVKERKDISALIDHLEQEGMVKGKLGIFGQSLGGAIAIQTLATDARLQYGIVLSTFNDFRTITDDYFRFNLGFSYKWLSNYLVNRSGAIAGFDPDDASPLQYCKRVKQPVLMAHGVEDRRITIEYGKANFENLQHPACEFLAIEKANHLDVWQVGGEVFIEKIIAFLSEQTP